MRKLILLLTVFILPANAQENPLPGYLKIVNLISTETPTRIKVGEIRLNNDNPIEVGMASGNMGLLPDDYSFTVENPGTKPKSATDSFSLESGKSVMVVFYTEVKEYDNGDIEHRLRYSIMTRELAMNKPQLSVISLAKADPTFVKLGNTNLTLVPKQAHVHPVELEDTLNLTQGENDLGLIEILSPIHYLAFVYDNPVTKSLAMSLVEHAKIIYDPPKESFDTEEDNEDGDPPADAIKPSGDQASRTTAPE